ncbi:MAG: DUF4350 domain-containing protein [Actinobacteria bacterium]|nr:MAG: DUF4350 domain-containing protein [Actinomycetota bacterium]
MSPADRAVASARPVRWRLRFDTTTVLAVVLAIALTAGYALAVYLSREFYYVEAPPGSTFSAQPEGLRTAYRYLSALGADVRTLQQFETLPATGTLVIAAPEGLAAESTDAEAERLAHWVEGGGRLVLAGLSAGTLADTVAQATGVSRASAKPATLTPVQQTRFVTGVTQVAFDEARLDISADPGWVTTFRDGSGALLVSRTFGAGEVVWLADALPLSNAGLARADDGDFAVRLLASVPGPVFFDEYHHGFAKGGGAWDRLGSGGRTGVVLLLIAALALVVSRAQRVGPPVEEREVPAARTTAYIDSLAELYRRAGARAHALEALEDGLARALARRWGTTAAGLSRTPEAAGALGASRALRARETMTTQEFLGAAAQLRRVRCETEGRETR